MRLWSIHPKYLDTKGLVALWREALLAQKVLQSKTKGYKFHPQLERFKKCSDPVLAISFYLKGIWQEAYFRGYCFDEQRIARKGKCKKGLIKVAKGQLKFETEHLKAKLKKRDVVKYKQILISNAVDPHPLFRVVKGQIAKWEKRNDPSAV